MGWPSSWSGFGRCRPRLRASWAAVPDAGRVIAGRARGRRLAAPGEGTRPLADRVKETLFAILEPVLPGATVLDLFAGSGAAGIEALSRGAARVVFVDRDRSATAVIERNLRSTGLAGPTSIVRRSDALAYLDGAAATDGPFDVVVLDPPYEDVGLLEAALERLGAPGPADDGGRCLSRVIRPGHPRSHRRRGAGRGSIRPRRHRRAGQPPQGAPSGDCGTGGRPPPIPRRDARAGDGSPAGRGDVRRPDGGRLPRAGRCVHRPRPARDLRLRGGNPARAQQPHPGSRCGHGLLHDVTGAQL